MAEAVIQTSFAAGELSPSLYARVDLAKYAVGAASLRNFYVDYRGGASNRPGTQFIAACNAVAGRPRLLPFTVSVDAAYVIEVGGGYMRFYANSAQIQSSPGVPYTLTTPYAAADVAQLKYVQSVDVLTITHPAYPPYNLTRLTSTTFSLDLDMRGPIVQPPTNVSGRQSNHTRLTSAYNYEVTAISADGKEESLPTLPHPINCGLIAPQDNIVNFIGWDTSPSSPSSYRIYASLLFTGEQNSDPVPMPTVLGYIGASLTNSFVDSGIAPDFSRTPPQFQDPFTPGQIASVTVTSGGSGYGSNYYVPLIFVGDGTGAAGYGVIDKLNGTIVGVVLTSPGSGYSTCTASDATGTATYSVEVGQQSGTYPSCVTYFQQRRVYGGTPNFPESLVFSQIAKYNNFDTSILTQATDSITVSLASRQDNTIKSMVAMSTGLVVFTAGGAFLVSGGGSGLDAITPANITALPQASSGANDLPPIVVNYDILYCQNRGAVIRDLAFNFGVQNYTGTDRSVLASHLFLGHTLADWCYAEEPFRLVYVVRDDGVLLLFTYVPEQEVFAWTPCDTLGLYTSVANIPEGQENAVYTIVQRVIQGEPVYYVERFASRVFASLADAWFVDCGLAYTGAPATHFSGLDHLEGQSVVALADGVPILNLTVTAGAVDIPVAASRVIIGLPYTAQLQTLQLDVGEPTIQGKRKLIAALTLRVNQSLGLQASTISFDKMVDLKDLQVPYTPPIAMYSGDARVLAPAAWSKPGQIYIQQTLPLPCSILGVIPEVVIGDTAK